ncbi:MAG: hypothetical protein ABJF56_16530 [Maribacter dokdonensis]|uniref:hypothetical protein n=1 Tax=Maribacter dokdonensis TaxID=320912 RepID=UPI003265897A
MKTFVTDLIPKIQRYSQKLDDLTKLTNQHWVSLGEISEEKKVFIFRSNNQLLISLNGIVERGSWDYLGNKSLLLETKNHSYLMKHGFLDENIFALKLDSTETYAFFINETRYDKELNNITDILIYLEDKYLVNSIANKDISDAVSQIAESDKSLENDTIHKNLTQFITVIVVITIVLMLIIVINAEKL